MDLTTQIELEKLSWNDRDWREFIKYLSFFVYIICMEQYPIMPCMEWCWIVRGWLTSPCAVILFVRTSGNLFVNHTMSMSRWRIYFVCLVQRDRRGHDHIVDVLDTKLCDKVCRWLATGQWFSPGTPVSSTNKTDAHDIAEEVKYCWKWH